MPFLRIEGLEAENLRGYTSARLTFDSFCVLVGENNEGKSSILKLLDRLMTSEEAMLTGSREMTRDEEAFWMPANDAHHRARRLTLLLRFEDGRNARPFGPDENGIVRLRFSISKTQRRCRLNVGFPTQGETHDEKGWTLLESVREHVDIVLIPAVRDASASRFAKALREQVDNAVSQKLRHARQGGAPAEYRSARGALEVLQGIVSKNSASLGIGNGMAILKRMMTDSEVRFEADMEHVIKWIHEGLQLAISTGDHDALMVRPTEVGNGLQSILDISLTLGQHTNNPNKQLMLIIEEPEVFLHPAAQRELIIALQNAANDDGRQIIVTTHSPIIVDECGFEDTVLVRKQRFYCPTIVDSRRAAINTSLMASAHAESFFAHAVLLVEGPGDAAYLNTLLRRLRRLDEGAGLTRLVVQATGSKTHFAPWINLFRAYGQENDRPITWLSLMDGDAATKEGGERAVLRALRDAAYSIPITAEAAVMKFGDMPYDDADARIKQVATVNTQMASLNVHLFGVDLEWAMVDGGAGDDTLIQRVLEEERIAGLNTRAEYARKLGSKVGSGKAVEKPLKAPHIRARMAELVSFAELSSEMESVLKAAMSLVVKPGAVRDLWKAAVS